MKVAYHSTQPQKPRQFEQAQEVTGGIINLWAEKCKNLIKRYTRQYIDNEPSLQIVDRNPFAIWYEILALGVNILRPKGDEYIQIKDDIDDIVKYNNWNHTFKSLWNRKLQWNDERVVKTQNDDQQIPLQLESSVWVESEVFQPLA